MDVPGRENQDMKEVTYFMSLSSLTLFHHEPINLSTGNDSLIHHHEHQRENESQGNKNNSLMSLHHSCLSFEAGLSTLKLLKSVVQRIWVSVP